MREWGRCLDSWVSSGCPTATPLTNPGLCAGLLSASAFSKPRPPRARGVRAGRRRGGTTVQEAAQARWMRVISTLKSSGWKGSWRFVTRALGFRAPCLEES